MSKSLFFLIAVFFTSAYSNAGLNKAQERLAITTDLLLSIGEEMEGEPNSGMLVVGDTLSINVKVLVQYSYQFIIWTDSAFNMVDFWLTSPLGRSPIGDLGDHGSLILMPDSSEAGTWKLNMELLGGAHSDTAYYATAIYTGPRARSSL